MYFEKLKFYQYRNIKNPEIELSPVLNVFIGKNAQGKTNLLEAVYLILTGKSFRPSKNIHIINKDAHNEVCVIGGNLVDKNVKQTTELQIKNGQKLCFLNRKRISSSLLQKKYPCILFSPESLSAIKSGPDERRQLLDDWISLYKPEALNTLQEFNKCLRSRNKLLRDFKAEKIYADEFDPTFASINHSFYRLATALTMLRIEAIKEIHSFFNKAMQRISNSKLKAEIRYLVSDRDVTDLSKQELADWLKTRADDLRFAEVSSASSLFGPHKHDIQVEYDGNDSRYFCSQGQQRALILSFKIAQIVYYNARYGVFPLLLLDDVLSELDEEKRSFLVAFLKEHRAQTFISSTELDQEIKNQGAMMKVFCVEEGEFRLQTEQSSLDRNGEQTL
jgi:DNA replication and repair protein RecF